MDETIRFLLRHGYVVLFLSVSADQLGLPVPSVPVLLAMGALSGSGEFSLAAALPLAVAGCLVAPPLAAMFRMGIRRFLVWDAAGSLLWAGAFLGAGFLFRVQIERVGTILLRMGTHVFVLLASALAFYVAWKVALRWRFFRRLRVARITPEELNGKMEAGEDLTVVDLRHPLEFDADRVKVPGALHMLPEELAKRHEEIPRGRDVVLYCTCPNEATSAMMTLRLHRLGITRVRPLSGGFDAWVEGGFPLETKTAAPSPLEGR